jgi:hypothetical protein
MQPETPPGAGTPDHPLPIAQVQTGMTVLDSTGDEVGTVTEVQMPGTDSRPGVPEEQAGQLIARGWFRIGGAGLLATDHYADGEQVGDVTAGEGEGVVTLTVRKDDLRRAE